jgi:hypothetical protein
VKAGVLDFLASRLAGMVMEMGHAPHSLDSAYV